MHSPGHRSNLLSPDVDRVGIAVVASRGVLYAVADYSHGVESMGAREAESRVAALIKQSGLTIMNDASVAREACAMNSGVPRSATPQLQRRCPHPHCRPAAACPPVPKVAPVHRLPVMR